MTTNVFSTTRALTLALAFAAAMAGPGVLQAQPVRGCFQPATEVPGNGTTYVAPAAARLGSAIFIFIRGADGTVLVQRQGSGTWNRLPGVIAYEDPAAVEMDDSLYVFIRASDNHVYQNTYAPGSGFLRTYAWSGWRQVPGTSTLSGPSVAAKDGRLVLVVRGLYNRVFWATFDRYSWSPWSAIPGLQTSVAPAVSNLYAGIWVFAVNSTDYRINYTYTYSGGSNWSVWQATSGPSQTILAPGIAPVYDPGALPELFVVSASYSQLEDNFVNLGMYGASEPLGSRTQSRVAVAFDSSSRLNLFFRGDDYRVYTRVQCMN
jgi:hypothetical protein